MSNPNNQPDLKSMARTRRRSNNRHTTFSQRERLPSRYHDVGPWTVTPPTVPPAPQNITVQPHNPEAGNHNPAGAPSTNFAPGPATTHTNTLLPLFSQTQPSNKPETPTTASKPTPQQFPHQQQHPPPHSQQTLQPQQPPPPKPHLHPSSPSPTPSITSANLEDVDLRSPSDDPDYDFIETSEATHSARNAQPDRADKYPELGAKAESVAGGGGGGGKEAREVKVVAEAKKKKGKGWFGFLQ